MSGQQGAFATATLRVEQEADDRRTRAAEARQEARRLRADSDSLTQRFQQLKRRRMLADADEHLARAREIEAEVARLPERIAEYSDAYAEIGAGAPCEPLEAPPVVARAATEVGDLPPGATPTQSPSDCTVNFQEWLEARDVSVVEESLLDEMLHDLVGEVPKARVQNSSRCPDCARDLVLDTVKALLVCPECGSAQPHLDATPSCVAYDEGGRREMYSNFTYTYKRANHMFERIGQMEATHASVITDELLELICQDLHQRRVRMEDLTAQKVKDILKRHKLRKAYEFVVPITRRLQGKPPIKFTRETREKIKRMFEAVQRPFERHCPPDRANFLSYWYVLAKFLELLGAYSVLPYLTLLKGKSKLQRQDAIWKKICADLDWEFIPSI